MYPLSQWPPERTHECWIAGCTRCSCWDKRSKFCKCKMADWRHIQSRFLAISRRHIGWLMRNFDRRWRATRRYRSHDQSGNYRNFKTADSRYFENSFVSISQPRIIRYRGWKLAKKSQFCKFKMADGRHIESRLLAISRRRIGRLTRNSEWKWRIPCR